MKQRVPLQYLTFLAICVVLSLVAKRLVSPITNLLTDFIRLPGGGAAAAFSLMFLTVGTAGMNWRWATTVTAFVQCLLALSLGMSGYQGPFAILTYTLPGFVIDLVRLCRSGRDKTYFALSCASANTAAALLSNLLVFHLKGIAFLLWMLIAALFGLFGGLLGEMLFRRLAGIPEFRKVIPCQKD